MTVFRSKEELALWWKEYKESGGVEQRNRLVEHYLWLVEKVVGNRGQELFLPGGVDDLRSVGSLGLIDAVEKFDFSRGVRFEAYARYRIRGAILDWLRDNHWIPRSARRKGAKALPVIVGEGVLKSRAGENGSRWSQPLTLEKLAVSREEVPGRALEEEDDFEALIRFLPRIEKTVVRLFYLRGRSPKEIANALGVCSNYVSQIHRRAIGRLRLFLETNKKY